MNLLNVDANAKTVKGQKVGYLTGVLYLAPYDVSGINVCAMSELAGCQKTCLFVQGRAGISAGSKLFTATNGYTYHDNAIIRCRIKRTNLFHNDRERLTRAYTVSASITEGRGDSDRGSDRCIGGVSSCKGCYITCPATQQTDRWGVIGPCIGDCPAGVVCGERYRRGVIQVTHYLVGWVINMSGRVNDDRE